MTSLSYIYNVYNFGPHYDHRGHTLGQMTGIMCTDGAVSSLFQINAKVSAVTRLQAILHVGVQRANTMFLDRLPHNMK